MKMKTKTESDEKHMRMIGRYALFTWWIYHLKLSVDEFHCMINSPINDLTLRAFTKMHLDEEGKSTDAFTVRLNTEERKQLEEDKKIIEQTKDSTAIKELANIGSIVIHDKKTAQIIRVILGNRRKNKRLGIVDFE